jgi:hypothetical protein
MTNQPLMHVKLLEHHPIHNVLKTLPLVQFDQLTEGWQWTFAHQRMIRLNFSFFQHYPNLACQEGNHLHFALKKVKVQPHHVSPKVVNDINIDAIILESIHSTYMHILQIALDKSYKRQSSLVSDLNKHMQALKYEALAETILTHQSLNHEDMTWFFKQHPTLVHANLGIIIDRCYAFVKKAKKGIQMVREQQTALTETIHLYETMLSRYQEATMVNIEHLKSWLIQTRHIVAKTEKPILPTRLSPYQVRYKQWTVSYGKNQEQNHYLTFSLAKKKHVFLHLDGYPSHHVILHADRFDEEGIRFAGEILLALNQLPDGHIVFAKVGSLKATSVKGTVIMRDVKKRHLKRSSLPVETILEQAYRIIL